MARLQHLLPFAIICAIGATGYAVSRMRRPRSLSSPSPRVIGGSRDSASLSAQPASQSGRPPPLPAPVASGPSGFGGWLIVILIGQTLAPFQIAYALADQFVTVYSLSLSQTGKVAAGAMLAGTGALLAFNIGVTVQMWSRKRGFPNAFLYQWFAYIAWGIWTIVMIALTLGMSLEKLLSIDSFAEEVARMVGKMVSAGLWVWYVKASRRVANTFVR